MLGIGGCVIGLPVRQGEFTFALSSPDEFLVWFFLQPAVKTPAPIFTISTSTSNDIILCKDMCLLGVPKKIIDFDPIFP